MNVAPALEPHLRPIGDLILLPGNPRVGDVPAIAESLERFGQQKPIVVDADGVILAGNHTYQAAVLLEWTHVAAVTSGLEGGERAGFALAYNRLSDLANYDDEALIAMLSEVAGTDLYDADLLSAEDIDRLLVGTGYEADNVIDVLDSLTADDRAAARAAELAVGKAQRKAERRDLPIEIFFSSMAGGPEMIMAANCGWGLGVLTRSEGTPERLMTRYPQIGRIGFMDNDWHDYDHDKHLWILRKYNPVYATTRDLVTKEQAKAAGVVWYSLEETLEHARQVAAAGVDNVIMIPKYTACLDALPESIGGKRVVLGYSVQSSYGGTEIPIEAFRGRPIHLLGGSWTNQRAYLDLMGEDVVSLDNNHILKSAKFGVYCLGDGTRGEISNLLPDAISIPFYPALAISLASIATTVRLEYGSPLNTPLTGGEEEE